MLRMRYVSAANQILSQQWLSVTGDPKHVLLFDKLSNDGLLFYYLNI